jgi:hypothetical protein
LGAEGRGFESLCPDQWIKGSFPVTSLTIYTGDMGDSFAAAGAGRALP